MKPLAFKCVNQLEENQKMHVIEQIKEIFFLSSSIKNFESAEKKELFFKKWCGDYLEYFLEHFFVFIDLENLKVYGYICGVKDTTKSMKLLKVPGLCVFEDLYLEFPAHLHINFHPDARGMGLGTKLVEEFISYLRDDHIKGLHLITSKDSDNTRFYQRLGFDICHERFMNNYGLYFMGKKL